MDLLGLDKLEPELAQQVQTIANNLESQVNSALGQVVTSINAGVTAIENLTIKGTITISVDLGLK
jgi:hypothetical protein